MSQSEALNVEDVHYAYGKNQALKGVTFALKPGRFTALLGPNGAGKTTLFGLLTRLLALQKGRITIGGMSVSDGAKALQPLGLVFQLPTLDLDLTVRENLGYFAALRGMSKRLARERIDGELERLEMVERAGEKVRALNGGHRRRVELARALLHEPEVLLVDEPTVGLDVESRTKICTHVHQLACERGLAVLWATHLIDEVWQGDDLIVLGDGHILDQGSREEVIARANATDLAEAFAVLTGVGKGLGANGVPTGVKVS
ncbi:MAG: ABC transporter ATP-binding protein [Pseudomonadota bacterium]